MWNFQYKHGDRPLEGFTIERAAGRGGFGEVYFAISDTGRQVALKVVQGYEQIELRGISQCMNLKSPHLITIFDVRYNEEKRPFVIMEYVAGPSLRQLLDEAPAGLGTQKAAFFLREMGKGLSFLHDNGIVHRDLKPANVFYENGYVKIGDYGLSKMINPAQNSAQTVTVGTVHYMAPEVGAGKYDRSIDIYALGAVLYEMLAGMVPFNGATPSEVLMKHLSMEPDTTGIAEPFATVIKKAMAKDPAKRYQTVQEMVEAVFGAEHIRQSVSVFSPDELSVVAGRIGTPVGVKVGVGGGGTSSSTPGAKGGSDHWDKAGAWAGRMTDRVANLGDRMADLGARAVGGTTGISSRTLAVEPPAEDTLTRGQRRLLGIGAAIAAGILAGIFEHNGRPEPVLAVIPFVMLTILGGAVGIRCAVHRLTPQVLNDPSRISHLAVGGMATLFGWLFSLPFLGVFGIEHSASLSGIYLATFIPLFFMKAADWAAPDRPERVNFWNTAFLAGLFGFILSNIFHGEAAIVGMTLIGISIVTQLLSPWNAAAARNAEMEAEAGESTQQPTNSTPPPIPGSAAIPAPNATTSIQQMAYSRVPTLVRVLWLIFALLSFAAGLTFLIVAGLSDNSRDFPAMICAGIGFSATSIIFLIQACRARIYVWWTYLFKPLVVIGCLGAILIASAAIAGASHNDTSDLGIGIFMIVFSSITMLAVLAIPDPKPTGNGRPVDPIAAASFPRKFGWGVRQNWPPQPWRFRNGRPPRLRRPVHIPSPFAVLGSILLVAAILLAVGVALNVPEAIAVGLPDPKFALQLSNHVFVGYPQWPELLSRMGTVAASLLALLSITFLTIARRHDGIIHILRGVIGTFILFAAVSSLSHAFHPSVWTTISDQISAHHQSAAMAEFLGAFESGRVIAAGVTFIFAQILLNWHPRNHRAMPVEQTGAKA